MHDASFVSYCIFILRETKRTSFSVAPRRFFARGIGGHNPPLNDNLFRTNAEDDHKTLIKVFIK
jgi:hypothetical protein